MKIPLILLAIVALAAYALLQLAPPPAPQETLLHRSDLPWQVEPNADGSSEVFDLKLGNATLADAEQKFGPAEHYAVFETGPEHSVLEAYFGKVMFGPLEAKVVVTLQATEAERRQWMANANKREPSPTGDWKYLLSTQAGSELRSHLLEGISYVPATRGLDKDFFLRRFGEPAAVLRESEHAVSWFYPSKGVSILIDDKGREVFEYRPPKDFKLPEDATPYLPDLAPAGESQ